MAKARIYIKQLEKNILVFGEWGKDKAMARITIVMVIFMLVYGKMVIKGK